MDRQVDLVIIGAGPAGMSAALYASRAGVQTLMIDGTAPGGKLLKTYRVENYPGVPDTPGPDLAVTMYQQSVSFGAEYMFGEVETINQDKQVILKDGSVITAKAILIATGAKERHLNIPGEEEALGHGESFCAVCDGAFFRDQEVVVIGGGDSALEEAQFLTRFASHVTIVIRRDQFRASQKAVDEVEKNDKIRVITRHIPKKILVENGSVSGIVFENVETGMELKLPCQGVFPFIGHIPETSFAKDLGILDENGYIVTQRNTATSMPGVYAAGDCTKDQFRQIVTAAGAGALASDAIFQYLLTLED